jgi:hypothetical protein
LESAQLANQGFQFIEFAVQTPDENESPRLNLGRYSALNLATAPFS